MADNRRAKVKACAIVAFIVIACVACTYIWLFYPRVEKPTREVTFQHQLDDRATHYSVIKGRYLFSSYSFNVGSTGSAELLANFEPFPESVQFTHNITVTYGDEYRGAFKFTYYDEVAHDEFVVINVEYVYIRIDVTEDGRVIWAVG